MLSPWYHLPRNAVFVDHADAGPRYWMTSKASADGKGYEVTLHYRLPILATPGTTIRFREKPRNQESTT